MTHRLQEQDMGGQSHDSVHQAFTDLAGTLEELADESEQEGMLESAQRLRNDAAWYRNRFGGKK